MKTSQFIRASFLALAIVISTSVFADQIDKEAGEAALSNAPAGILVKVNPETKTVEVFRVKSLDSKVVNKSASNEETISAINSIENSANKIAEYQLKKGELDKDSSTEAWYYYNYSYGYRWNRWGGYNPYSYNWYRPYYNAGYFNYGRYNYNYGYNYNYNNCNYGWYY